MPQITDIAANSSHAWRVMCAGAATCVDPTASDYGERPTRAGVHRRGVLDGHYPAVTAVALTPADQAGCTCAARFPP